MKKFFGEFKEFISKGNVLDMAIGIIIGGAFTAIVSSLVTDIITPLIGLIFGGFDFSAIAITVKDATLNIGLFLNALISFVLTAFVLFCIVKAINKAKKSVEDKKKKGKEAPAAAAPEPSAEEKLLTEIRDLLKKQNRK